MAKKILSILIVLSFLPVGCYWKPAQINRSQDIINNWRGYNIDDLIDKWGYPQQLFTETNGNRVYVYSRVVTYIPPIWTAPITDYKIFGGMTSSRYCNTYFETNDNKTIVDGSYEGNGCQLPFESYVFQ